jgi:hypothetical protein
MRSPSKILSASTPVLLLTTGASVQAEERPDHSKGLPANTLEEAVHNFSEYNHKLETLLDQDKLGSSEFFTVHELTYTLEIALEKIRTGLETLAETQEEVHVASETADTETVRSKGREYLSISRKLNP